MQREFRAPGKRRPLDDRNDGQRPVLDGIEHAHDMARAGRGCVPVAQVDAGAKSRAVRTNHRDAFRGRRFLGEEVRNAFDHLRRKRVAFLGPIERDRANGSGDGTFNCGHGHLACVRSTVIVTDFRTSCTAR